MFDVFNVETQEEPTVVEDRNGQTRRGGPVFDYLHRCTFYMRHDYSFAFVITKN